MEHLTIAEEQAGEPAASSEIKREGIELIHAEDWAGLIQWVADRIKAEHPD